MASSSSSSGGRNEEDEGAKWVEGECESVAATGGNRGAAAGASVCEGRRDRVEVLPRRLEDEGGFLTMFALGLVLRLLMPGRRSRVGGIENELRSSNVNFTVDSMCNASLDLRY